MPMMPKSYEQTRGRVRQAPRKNNALRNSVQWRKVRDQMIKECPVCPDPFGRHRDKAVLAKEVHHIMPLEAEPSLAYVDSNLVPLCQSCHRIADNLHINDPIRYARIDFKAYQREAEGGDFSASDCNSDR